MEASSVTGLLYKQLNFRGERQKVISNNIANINTPNYKTKDIKFRDELKKSQEGNELQLKVTHKDHIVPNNNIESSNKIKMYDKEGLEEQNDGNNVNLDQQMSEMAKNSVMFDALQGAIKKDAAWFKEIIASSGKN